MAESVFRLWADDLMLLSYPSNILPPPHEVLDDPLILPPPPQPTGRMLLFPHLLCPFPSHGSGLWASEALTPGPRPPAPPAVRGKQGNADCGGLDHSHPCPLKLRSLNISSLEASPGALSWPLCVLGPAGALRLVKTNMPAHLKSGRAGDASQPHHLQLWNL